MLHAPEIASNALRTVELSESGRFDSKEHVRKLGWLLVKVDSAACELMNASFLIE